MLKLKEHSGSFVANKGSWANYHAWLESEGIARFDKDLQTLIVLPKRAKARIGRNEPCSCGSGKKYKKCCINK
jgi:uncharacterized protein YchJ